MRAVYVGHILSGSYDILWHVGTFSSMEVAKAAVEKRCAHQGYSSVIWTKDDGSNAWGGTFSDNGYGARKHVHIFTDPVRDEVLS